MKHSVLTRSINVNSSLGDCVYHSMTRHIQVVGKSHLAGGGKNSCRDPLSMEFNHLQRP